MLTHLFALLLGLALPLAAQEPPTLRVFLLAGQSNMEGHGVVDLDDARDYNGGRGTLAAFLRTAEGQSDWKDLQRGDGSFATRNDVFVTYRTGSGERKCGPLSIGFAVYGGRHHIGPELGIGRVLGEHCAEPVLLVKTAWGGKSLEKDFRPPSAGGEVGPFYRQMLAEYREALAQLAVDHPQLAKHRPRLDGFLWFQGWNDACDAAATKSYAQNLTHLIADLRSEFADPELAFVVGETGNWEGEEFRNAQRLGCLAPAIVKHTRFVATRRFLRKAEDSPNTTHGHHWYGNGESYLKIGDALGRAMAGVLVAEEPPAIPERANPLRWSETLDAFDREATPPRHPIVFVGSSSIRLWKTLAEDMAPLPVLNRGFGGSGLFDSIYWLERLVARHDPAMVVVFAGSNDIAGESPRSATWVAERFDELVLRLRALGCSAPLVYISITPAPSRVAHLTAVREANALISARCARDSSLHFLDAAATMVDANGQPDPQWFAQDLLHLNAKGYAHWTSQLRPLLEMLHSSHR